MCASSQRIARMRKRSIDRENVDGSVETWEPPSFKIVWGPVSEERAVRFGAISGCESILIRPTMTLELEGILQRIRALMPDAMFPREGDDADSLARRLGDCDFLDDIHCRKGGTGRRYIRLNNTTYAQPRRVTWSELVSHELIPQEFAGEEDATWCLFAYTQAYRHPEDWRCRPMPSPVQDLKHYVWQAAKATGRLSDYCAQHAPTSCQLMIYYVLLRNCIGRHRDNFSHEHFQQYLDGVDVLANLTSGHSASGDSNSQVVGSDVLIWTDGPAGLMLQDHFICCTPYTAHH